MAREHEIKKERLKKIDELRKQGIEPYSYIFDKRDSAKRLQKEYDKVKPGQETSKYAKIAGRVMIVRDLGKISFINLQDSSGEIQIILQQDKTPRNIIDFFRKYIDVGDFIGVSGDIIRTKRGELSILTNKIELLSKALLPLPEKFHGLKDKEERYRKRYLDLIMNPEVKEVFEKRGKIISAIREFLTKKGYIEVETPILQPIYGGTSAKPFESQLNALKMKVYLRISNEMYLKRLIGGGYEKIFEFSKDFRNEGIDSTHNPEFTLMETMCAYADYKQNMDLVEEMLEFVTKKVIGTTKVKYQGKEIDFKRPWKRIKMIDAIKHFSKLDVEKMSDAELKKKLRELNMA